MHSTPPEPTPDQPPAHPPPPAPPQTTTPTPTAGETVEEAQVWEALRACYDPEIPINVVDLGLIYSVRIQERRVDVKMTLTAPGCHLGGQIAADVQAQLLALEAVEEAHVDFVWDPPWQPTMISPAGRRLLGLDD